ncbi:MAG TPA: GNAT family N-acetyltransferase [Magnetospirillum sp.]|nr:GNAT family N-acetyltransferase [Magnetospirillum sp.]
MSLPANSISIRDADENDAESILNLLEKLWAFEGEIPDAPMRVEDLRHLLKFDNQMRIILAQIGQQVVGLAQWGERVSIPLGGKNLWLWQLIVDEAHRGQGVGRALITELKRLSAVHGYKRIEFFVREDNPSAKNFYRSVEARPTQQKERWIIAIQEPV